MTNCVVEVVDNDSQGRSPMLSLRFYYKPSYPHAVADRSAEAGRPLYDDDTPIGTEINLGPEMARSLVEQIQSKWPDFLKVVAADSET